jgi:protein-disulfide isomerase
MNATHWGETLFLPVTPERDHVRGSPSAAATLVEYGDYECPYCHAAHAVVTDLRSRLQDRLCFVFRHFPLTTVHPHAQTAAEGAEAAANQRKFWPMHDALLTSDAAPTMDVLIAAATALGLDLPSFRAEIANHVHVPRIREDFMSGIRSGANGTPTFYINGVRHDGPWHAAALFAAVNQRISQRKLTRA